MKKLTFLIVLGLAVILTASSASAVSVSLYTPANVGITSFDWGFDPTTNTITLYETWGAVGHGFVIFDGLETGVDYHVNKNIYNFTGVNWDRFSNELLDPAGDAIDAQYDQPIEPWVPNGYSHSNEMDGLSFAQGSIGRTSLNFSNLLVMSWAPRFRRVLQWSGHWRRCYELETFGIRDNDSNQPFLLAQRPNESAVVPEPATLLLFGAGLLGAGLISRKK